MERRPSGAGSHGGPRTYHVDGRDRAGASCCISSNLGGARRLSAATDVGRGASATNLLLLCVMCFKKVFFCVFAMLLKTVRLFCLQCD